MAGLCDWMRLSALLLLLAAGATAAEEGFTEQLDRLLEKQVQMPAQQTREVLDRLEPMLDQATTKQRIDFLLVRTRNLALLGELEPGLELARQVLAEGIEDRPQHAHFLALTANLAMLARRFETAFEFLHQGLALLDEAAAPDRPIEIHGLAAYLYAMAGDFDRARLYGRRGIESARTAGNKRQLCIATQRQGYVYRRSGNVQAAISLLEDALERCQSINDPITLGVLRHNLAEQLRQTGDHDRADALFSASVEQLQAADYVVGLDEARLNWARLQHQMGNHDRARELVETAYQGLARRQVWDLLADAYRLLASLAHEADDHAQAVEHLVAHIAARDALFSRERAVRLASIQAEFDSFFEQHEIALLNERVRIARLQEHTHRQRRHLRAAALVAGILGVAGLVLVLGRTRRDRRRYQKAAQHDSLTRLLNHSRFFEVGNIDLEASLDKGDGLALAIGDIDHFKRINDRHGHLDGDRVLKVIAEQLHQHFEAMGTLGRLGGEEFGVIVSGIDLPTFLRRLEGFVADYQARLSEEGLPATTMSFGIARMRPGEGLRALYNRADQALYRAKHGGRGRIETD